MKSSGSAHRPIRIGLPRLFVLERQVLQAET